MTYFFALKLPDKARSQVAAFAERWQSQVDPALNARWVAPENYHITLKFLGNVSPAILASGVKSAAIHAARQGPLLIEQQPSVLFPVGKPSVLWLEIVPSYSMKLLAIGMEGSLRIPGVRREHRPYKPHITLAHCQPEAEIAELLLTEQAFASFTVNRFVLMQTLPPEQRAKDIKARYNIVQAFPFGNTQS